MGRHIDLSRFTKAHERSFQIALREIQNGYKETHWMWYIFPQMKGLGYSSTSQYYAIQNVEEAIAFLHDPYLSNNLVKICTALLELKSDNATAIFGKTDARKLKSCMTLFSSISEDDSVFHQVLVKYFDGIADRRTLKILDIPPAD